MSAPDLTRKVIGFRSWRLNDGELRPHNSSFSSWKVGENRAQCERHKMPNLGLVGLINNNWYFATGTEKKPVPPESHSAPHPGCDCGYYAWHSLERIASVQAVDGYIHGAIVAWGKVEVHADGFRAEYAQPVAFGFSDLYTLRSYRTAEEFARSHGIRFVPLAELEEFATAFGAPVPEDMRPESTGVSYGPPTLSPGTYLTPNTFHISNIQFNAATAMWTPEIVEKLDSTPERVRKARKKFTGPPEHTRADQRKRAA